MKLATVRTSRGPTYGIVTDKGFVDLGARLGSRYPDLKSLIAARAIAEAQKLVAEKPDIPLAELTWLPVIPNPGKILCVGLNYQEHVAETGRDNTEQPAFFIRVAESQVGHQQPLLRPKESTHLDFEAEIAVIIGKAGTPDPAERSVGLRCGL
jgi:2-keto-4-pentenoate hydratase/2-oxohepta-3-ene-1,7-dioic acid hydratase in catechol pathway